MKKTSKYNKSKGVYKRRRIVGLILLEIFIAAMVGIGFVLFDTNRTQQIIGKESIEFSDTQTMPVSIAYSTNYVHEESQPYLKEPVPLTGKDLINSYIDSICLLYPNVEPSLVKSIIQQESCYQPEVENGNCIGLMQVSSYWHSQRMKKLGVTNLHDSYGNILVGVDYINELFVKYKDVKLVLMLYSMDNDEAFRLYKHGSTTKYVTTVLTRQMETVQAARR